MYSVLDSDRPQVVKLRARVHVQFMQLYDVNYSTNSSDYHCNELLPWRSLNHVPGVVRSYCNNLVLSHQTHSPADADTTRVAVSPLFKVASITLARTPAKAPPELHIISDCRSQQITGAVLCLCVCVRAGVCVRVCVVYVPAFACAGASA